MRELTTKEAKQVSGGCGSLAINLATTCFTGLISWGFKNTSCGGSKHTHHHHTDHCGDPCGDPCSNSCDTDVELT